LCDVQEQVSNKPLGLRGWLVRPLYIKNLLFTGFASCLALLAFAPIPSGGLPVVFFVAVSLGIGTVSALVFSPDVNRAGSNLAAFFLAFLMHGLVAVASVRGGYYPRMLAGASFGQAIRNSTWLVILEWGAIMVLGRFFAATRRPTVPMWWVVSALILLAAAIALPEVQGRGYRVVAGRPPVKYWSFSEPMGSAESPIALVDDAFSLLQTGYDRKSGDDFSILKAWDIKNGKQWTMDVVPSKYMLPWAFLALGEHGEVLIVHETPHTNEASDRAVWVTRVDIPSATKSKPEFVVRAPWLDPDASAVLLNPAWRRPPLSGPSGVSIDADEVGGPVYIRGPGFRWDLMGDPKSMVFILGEDVVVMRETRDEKHWYHIFLLPYESGNNTYH